MRVFTPEQVDVLRKVLREQTQTRVGPKPELVGLEEVASWAACSMRTTCRRLGVELPAGRKLAQGSRAQRSFAPKEAKQIVAWPG